MTLLHRRQFLQLAASTAPLITMPLPAWAQSYPLRPVRITVGFAAGSTGDILARLIGQWLSEKLGQPFVIDNRPGASGNIATEAVVNSSPDGYALLLVAGAHTVNATLYDKLNFDFIRDITPVASISRESYVMLVHPAVPAQTVQEFIAHSKANPSKISMASAGNGTVSHVAGELFKMGAGIDMAHVPYRGAGPALNDMLGGHVQVMFVTTSASIGHIKAGKLRPLAVTTATRLEALPDIPSVSDFVPGYEATSLWGLGAPRSTPAEIIEKLNKEVNAALADPQMKARLADLGGTIIAGSPADFGKLIAAETVKWAKVIRTAKIKPG